MKLKYKLEPVTVGNETVQVPVGEEAVDLKAVFATNEEASRLLELLAEETTEERIFEDITKEYDSSNQEEIKSYIHGFVEQLREYGLLEE